MAVRMKATLKMARVMVLVSTLGHLAHNILVNGKTI